jgi:DNA-directed RNA polymerase specialized sigma24 family protein
MVAAEEDRVKEGAQVAGQVLGGGTDGTVSQGAVTGGAAEAVDTLEATSQREMMRLVAQLYYVRELGQPEIAALTGFSISKVSRLLASARASGVVRISVEGAGEFRGAACYLS